MGGCNSVEAAGRRDNPAGADYPRAQSARARTNSAPPHPSPAARAAHSAVFQEITQAATSRHARLFNAPPQLTALEAVSDVRGQNITDTVRADMQKTERFRQNIKHATQAIAHVKSLTAISTNRRSDEMRVLQEEGNCGVEDAMQFNPFLNDQQKNDIYTNAGNNAVFENFQALREIQEDAERVAASVKFEMEDSQDVEVSDQSYQTILTKAKARAYDDTANYRSAETVPSNCVDKVSIAFDFLAQKEDNLHLDNVRLVTTGDVSFGQNVAAITQEPAWLPSGPDHYLLVIGRDPATDATDSKTWNDTTVVCDPWAGRSYAASVFEEEMVVLSSTTGGATRTELLHSHAANTPYNPSPL